MKPSFYGRPVKRGFSIEDLLSSPAKFRFCIEDHLRTYGTLLRELLKNRKHGNILPHIDECESFSLYGRPTTEFPHI